MRITIVQTEIEEAIRNHILSQIQVQDGMEIEIDLRATRGAEGFQADIDIHPKRPGGGSGSGPKSGPKGSGSNAKPLGIEKTVKETKSSGRGSKSSNTGNTSETTSVPVAANEQVSEDKTDDKVEVVLTETPADTAQIEAAAEAPAEEPVSEAEAVTAKKPLSLFAQKKKDESAEEAPPAGERKSLFGDLKRPVNA